MRPLSTRASTASATASLKVLAMGNRSPPRWPTVRPLSTTTAATPSFPPDSRSIAAKTLSSAPLSAAAESHRHPLHGDRVPAAVVRVRRGLARGQRQERRRP